MFFEETLVFKDLIDAHKFNRELIADGYDSTFNKISTLEYNEKIAGRIRDLWAFFQSEKQEISADNPLAHDLSESYDVMINTLSDLRSSIQKFLDARNDGDALGDDPDYKRYWDILNKKKDFLGRDLPEDERNFLPYLEDMVSILGNNNLYDHVPGENGKTETILRKRYNSVDDLTVSVPVPVCMRKAVIGPEISVKNRKAYNIKTSANVEIRDTYEVKIPIKFILTEDPNTFERMTEGCETDPVSYNSVKLNLIATKNLADLIIDILKTEDGQTFEDIDENLSSESVKDFPGTDELTFTNLYSLDDALEEMVNYGLIKVNKEEDDDERFYL